MMNNIDIAPIHDEFEFDFSLCHGNRFEEITNIKNQKKSTDINQKSIKKCPLKRKPTIAYMPTFYGR